MRTEIQPFIHDDGPGYHEVIRLVGQYLADPVVTKHLGHPISTKPGDIWLIAKYGESVTDSALSPCLRTRPSCTACM
jgi:hypothetical protein